MHLGPRKLLEEQISSYLGPYGIIKMQKNMMQTPNTSRTHTGIYQVSYKSIFAETCNT